MGTSASSSKSSSVVSSVRVVRVMVFFFVRYSGVSLVLEIAKRTVLKIVRRSPCNSAHALPGVFLELQGGVEELY